MSASESLKDVTLRPWPAPKKEELSQQDLYVKIEQLTAERGHLRDITEKSLREGLETGKDAADDATESGESEKLEKDAPTKQEKLETIFNAQREMYGHLEWAKFAATNTLDLLSLVLSQDPNKRAATSFSQTFREQGLNQGIPLGSFGVSRENHDFHVRKPDEEQRIQELEHRQHVVARGARMEALDSATDDILKAAKKLEREIDREAKYWQEIVSVSGKGWPIQRLRQNARHVPFGVRYGLPEASDHFKARGLAPLQMDKDGSIILDPALKLKPKTFRVRVSVDGKIIGTSQLSVEGDMKSASIEKSIQLARDSLFEEELYHEMSLETRQLIAYGVDFRDSVIRVDAPRTDGTTENAKLLIDCIPRDEPIASGQAHTHDWLARIITEALRLLLAHEHSMRLYRRSQLPPPLTARNQEKPSPPLLRTLLAVFRHLDGVDSLYRYLETVAGTLRSAGLEVTLETTRESSWTNLADDLKVSKAGLNATDQLLEIFTKPFDGKATMSLPTLSGAQSEKLIIDTRTFIGQPTFGTEHKLTLPSSLMTELGLFQQHKFPSVDEVKEYLDWILSTHIVHRLLKGEYLSRALLKVHEPKVTIVNKGGKKGSATSKDITVAFEDGNLTIKATDLNLNPQLGDAEAEQEHTWYPNAEDKSLRDLVKSWVG